MIRRLILALGLGLALSAAFGATDAQAQDRAYSRVWGGQYGRTDWERFYHYPYVWYPQNFWGHEYYRSSEDLYFRYPPEMVKGFQGADRWLPIDYKKDWALVRKVAEASGQAFTRENYEKEKARAEAAAAAKKK